MYINAVPQSMTGVAKFSRDIPFVSFMCTSPETATDCTLSLPPSSFLVIFEHATQLYYIPLFSRPFGLFQVLLSKSVYHQLLKNTLTVPFYLS